MIEFVQEAKRLDPPERKLPGRYKGGRRRRCEMPVRAECPCGVKSRPMSPERAELWWQRHIRQKHSGEDLRTL